MLVVFLILAMKYQSNFNWVSITAKDIEYCKRYFVVIFISPFENSRFKYVVIWTNPYVDLWKLSQQKVKYLKGLERLGWEVLLEEVCY